MFLSFDLCWEYQNELVAIEHAYIVFTSQLVYSAVVVQTLWLVVLVVFEAMDEQLVLYMLVHCLANLSSIIWFVSSIEWIIVFIYHIWYMYHLWYIHISSSLKVYLGTL